MQCQLAAKVRVNGVRRYDLTIDPEFKQLIPPLIQTERQQLEDNIKRDGCREPIALWGNIIIDGHNRYEICREYMELNSVVLPICLVELSLTHRLI